MKTDHGVWRYDSPVHPLIREHQDQIIAACAKHGVRRLELFGSAARGESSPKDFDFLVEFLDYDAPTLDDQWFGLGEDLEKILASQVDLVSARVIKNPYFLESVNRDRTTLYAA